MEEARQRYDAHARINVHLAWFGNELVGEHGIAQNPNWPRMTAQMATDLMAVFVIFDEAQMPGVGCAVLCNHTCNVGPPNVM